jgi:hypothetical protein
MTEDWEKLGADWQRPDRTEDANLASLSARVRARTRRLFVLVVAEALLSLGMLTVAVLLLLQRRDAAAVFWASALGVALVVTWAFTLHNRRNLWRTAGERPADYVRLNMDRARAALRTVWFARLFVAVAWTGYAVLYLMGYFAHSTAGFQPVIWGSGAAYSLAILLWSEWYRRRAQRELRVMREVERSLSGDAA